MFRKSLAILATSGLVALATGTVASASPQGFSMKVAPQVSFVSPGQSVVVDFTASNKSFNSATCDIFVEELAFDATPGGILIGAGQHAAGSLSTPVIDKNGRLTFDLFCNGVAVAKDSVNVKVR